MQIKNLKGEVLREVPGNTLKKADLWGANLRGADLRWADLIGADLSGVDLREADLSGAVLPLSITPSKGDFLGYKKVRQANGTCAVITLRIPADSQRTSALSSRKCRAGHVEVVEGEGFSPTYQKELHYVPGEVVYADGFDSDRREECVQGMHFFLTCEEAEAYHP
jgi:Family of unknown function (DUF5758)/Pentapeptide repeats (8 copies)